MKITGGKYNSRVVKTCEYENIKPTLSKIREGIFNTLSNMIDSEGKVFFDLFSGSGIMGLEALSRGFRVISFEQDKKTIKVIKETYKSLGEIPELYIGDALKNIKKVNIQADVIFIDPPYNSNLYEESLHIIKDFQKLSQNGIIIMEHPIDKEINTEGFALIKRLTEINKSPT